MKMFRPIDWFDGSFEFDSDRYITHLLLEFGRLQLSPYDINPRGTDRVFSDLTSWMDKHPCDAYARLFDWKRLDLHGLQDRLRDDPNAKPRIKVTAQITSRGNLSVKWYPQGWGSDGVHWIPSFYNPEGVIVHESDAKPSGFIRFTGDESSSYWGGRATNELMYIRGLGHISPKPRETYGYYATYNHDVVDSILICAVRSQFEKLIYQLRRSFEVEMLNRFEFETQSEDAKDDHGGLESIDRVVAWSIKSTD
ncbi:MAG: hypothetical protein ACRDHN_05595 [Thermomicrobiales bacterium]